MTEIGATARNSEVSGDFPIHQEDLGSGHTHLFVRIIKSNGKHPQSWCYHPRVSSRCIGPTVSRWQRVAITSADQAHRLGCNDSQKKRPRAGYYTTMLRHWPPLLAHESEVALPFQAISGVNSTVFLRRVSRETGATRHRRWPMDSGGDGPRKWHRPVNKSGT